jgi:putative transcriptional regulator
VTKQFNQIQKGTLLLAEPFMEDEIFKRAVILICEHSTEGTIGLILNKPTIFKINQMVGNFPHIDAFMYNGGPVENDRLNFLHAYSDIISTAYHIKENVYWNGNFDELQSNIKEKKILPHNILFFSGYAAWDYKQLEEEVKENSWIICNIDYPIFKSSEYMWKDISAPNGWQIQIVCRASRKPKLELNYFTTKDFSNEGYDFTFCKT